MAPLSAGSGLGTVLKVFLADPTDSVSIGASPSGQRVLPRRQAPWVGGDSLGNR